MSGERIPPVAIVGSGRLGRAFALRLVRAGAPAVTLVARTASTRRAAAAALGARHGRGRPAALEITYDLGAAVRAARWVLLAVPDRAIAGVARDLARLALPGWPRRVVLHHAGALGPEPLAELAACGAATGVFHPLEAFPLAVANGPEPAAAGWVRVEGAPRAVRAAGVLARHLGLRALPLRARLSADDRAVYHAAAALVANDLLALLSLGADLLVTLGARRDAAERALAQLAESAAGNVRRDGSIAAALTGPAARGDVDTVVRHLRALRRRSGAAARAYALLSLRVVEIAARSGRLPRAVAADLRRRLSGGRPRGRTV